MASGDVDLMEASIKHVTTITKDKTCFGGAVFLPNGDLLVAELSDQRLLLFADDFFYLQEFKLPNKPYDITIGSDGKLYIPMNNKTLIKCEIDGDDLNILDTFEIDKGTYFIDAYQDQLVTSCTDYFKFLDLTGKEVNSYKRSGGQTVVKVSTNLKRFYHRYEHEVVGRKISDGNEVFNFTDTNSLRSVIGIALDSQDNVYATGQTSKNVVQISKNRRKHRVLVEKFKRISVPDNILFHPRKNMFVVFAQRCDFEVYEFC